jgi:hypothetical protein
MTLFEVWKYSTETRSWEEVYKTGSINILFRVVAELLNVREDVPRIQLRRNGETLDFNQFFAKEHSSC